MHTGVGEAWVGGAGGPKGAWQDQSRARAGPGQAGWRGNSLPLWQCSPHAKLLMSLGPWPALKEPRVLNMVTREEGKATAHATQP